MTMQIILFKEPLLCSACLEQRLSEKYRHSPHSFYPYSYLLRLLLSMQIYIWRSILSVASAYKDRILVINTGRISSASNIPAQLEVSDEVDPLDCWGCESIADLCNSYGAGPVINLFSDSGYDDTDNEDIISVFQDSSTRDFDNFKEKLVDVVHESIAKKASDWFTLLHRFSYLY